MGKPPRPEDLISRQAAAERSGAISEILTAAATPGILSMAGGLPAPDSFPVADVAAAIEEVMSRTPASALQYAPVRGVPEMRETVAGLASDTGAAIGADRVLVTSGSHQGLDLTARVLLDAGDVVALDDPSYLGAVQTFRRAGAELLPIPGDDDGMDVDALADRLERGKRCKLVYVVPHFHNPTGAVLSPQRRERLAELAESYGFLIVEDDPYADLSFHGDRLPSVDVHTDRVVRLLSLSKSLCPGFRVAGMVVPEGLSEAVAMAKQSADLQTNTFGQHVIARLLAQPGFLSRHLPRLRTLYRERAQHLAALLADRLPWLMFPMPRGGLFFWCSMQTPDADRLSRIAHRMGVAVVPGPPFCVDSDGSHRLRLSYATLSQAEMGEAVNRLEAAHERLAEGTVRAS
jgi:2-aminoadipate transaminase